MSIICRMIALMACLSVLGAATGAQEQSRQNESKARAALRRLGVRSRVMMKAASTVSLWRESKSPMIPWLI